MTDPDEINNDPHPITCPNLHDMKEICSAFIWISNLDSDLMAQDFL